MNQSEKRFQRVSKARSEGTALEERDFSADRLVRFLNTSKMKLPGGAPLQEVLKSRDSIKDFVLSLDYPDYARLLVGINAMVRHKTGRDVWEMDGEGVLMGEQNIFPDQADKETLLAKSLEAAKIMAREGRSTEDISIQLAVSLTAVHPFIDGNGRTAKFLFTLLNAGYDSKLLKDVLTSDGFSNAVNALLFQGAATNVLDPAGELVWEKFDAWLEVPENRKKRAELIIDMIQNDQETQYLYDGVSTLELFKRQVKEGTDTNIYERIFARK